MRQVAVSNEDHSSSIAIGISNSGWAVEGMQMGVQQGVFHTVVPHGGPFCYRKESFLNCFAGCSW